MLAEIHKMSLPPAPVVPTGGDARPRQEEELRRWLGAARLRQALARAEAQEWQEAAAELSSARSLSSALPAFPLLEAAILLLADRRQEAVTGLLEAQRRDPRDVRVAHTVLLACYHTLRDPETVGQPKGEELLELAIANWVALLHHDGFWTSWLRDQLSRYGEERPELCKAGLRQVLIAELTARMEELATQAGDAVKLESLLHREIAAAEQLAAVGGLPWPGGSAGTLVCGPLMICALGRQEELGAFLAALPAGEETTSGRVQSALRWLLGQEDPPAGRRLNVEEQARLRRSFSRLGLAQALLDLERPDESWRALAELASPECRTLAIPEARERPTTGWSPAVCAETCPRFDRDNSGYAGQPEKTKLFERDALELAVGIQLALGRAGMTAPEGDLELAAGCFREALRLAAVIGQEDATERHVVADVLGRARTLADKNNLSPAIALLEASRAACAETAVAEALTGSTAELLAQRGIQACNDRQWEGAVTDLRRAVALNPHATQPLLALGHALRSRADQLRWALPKQAIELFLKAVRLLQARLPDLIGHPEVWKQLEETRDAARSCILQQATELSADRGFDHALQILEQGLAALPGDPALIGCQRDVVQQYSEFLKSTGQFERAVAVLRRAR